MVGHVDPVDKDLPHGPAVENKENLAEVQQQAFLNRK
jgi:hypothetical protein